ncbi:MAG: hypothetical protein GF316_18230 [Candidatus Lokiarchaeota archaeon]|nr:hypothetical protein [Candidatus Lokiarchaeota archaeon]
MREKYVFSFVSNTTAYLIFILANYVMALKFAPSLLGTWVFLNSVNNLGFMFVSVGFDKIHYQYSSKNDNQNYFGTYFFIKSILLLFNIAITLSIISMLGLWFDEFLFLIVLLLFSKTLFQFGNIFILNFKSNAKIFKAEVPFFFSYVSKSVLKLYIALNLVNINEPLLCICLFYLIFDGVYLFIIFMFSKNEFTLQKPNKNLIISYLKDAKLLIILSIFTVIAANIGNVLLDYSLGHETLSYFSLVHVYLIPSLIMITGSLFNVYLAHFSQFFEKNDISSIRYNVYIIERYSSIMFLSLILIIFVNGDFIFNLLLPEYTQSLPILYIMIFIPFIYGTSRPYVGQLISGKKQDTYAKIEILTQSLIITSIFLTIFVNYIVIQSAILDIYGYALSQTIPYLLWAFLNRYYCKKYFEIRSKNTILVHLLLAISSLAIVLFIRELLLLSLIQNVLFLNIISFLIVISIFFGLLWLTNQINKNDLTFFLNLLNIKNYVKSIRDEFSKN